MVCTFLFASTAFIGLHHARLGKSIANINVVSIVSIILMSRDFFKGLLREIEDYRVTSASGARRDARKGLALLPPLAMRDGNAGRPCGGRGKGTQVKLDRVVLVDALTSTGGWDVELHPVLGHGAPGQDNVLGFQPRDDLLILQGTVGVFLLHHLANHLAYRHGG
jgi:hypothetical protein